MSLSESLSEIVSKYFHDPKIGLNTTKIVKRIQADFPRKFKVKDIKDELNKIENVQLYRQTKDKKKFTKTFALNVLDSVHFDIADLPKYETPQNRHIRYLFVCVDVKSRYAWVKPQTNKTMGTSVKSFNEILKEMKTKYNNYPKQVFSDLEFNNKEFNKVCKEKGIKQNFSDRSSKGYKTQIAEAFIRTLKMMIGRYTKIKNTTKYVDALTDILENYNTSIHSSIKTDPKYAIEHNMTYKKEVVDVKKNALSIGLRVRIKKKRDITTQGDVERWSKKIYKIVKRIGVKYQLEDEETGIPEKYMYAKHQLQVIKDVIKPKPKPEPEPEPEAEEEVKKEGIDEVIQKVQKRRRFGRRVKKMGLEDQIHKQEGNMIKLNHHDTLKEVDANKLTKQKSKEGYYCDVCDLEYFENQPTYHSDELNVDVCPKCMNKHLLKKAKEEKETGGIDSVIRRRSSRIRKRNL